MLEKRRDSFRPRLGDEVGRILRGCSMSARGFFYEILPILEGANPYGHLFFDAEELARIFEVSPHMTRRYVWDLKVHRILKETNDGVLICPVLIRNHLCRL